jgi:S-adenosylmethionine hydrolase
MRPGILTLTTDFGSDGPYVAALKGVVLFLAPGTQLVDVSHTISPQNILEGAFVLSGLVETFPPGTVHLAVIDPGVGTARRLIAAKVAEQWFVLPDNGLISGVLLGRNATEVHEIVNPAIRRREVSATFHGRDILAPAAAFLLEGGSSAELGPSISHLVRLGNFDLSEEGHGLLAEVIFRDAFGNLVTNVSRDYLDGVAWEVEIAGQTINRLSRTYGEHSPGSLVALIGSNGWLEIAVVNGDAARHLSAGVGATVRVRRTG